MTLRILEWRGIPVPGGVRERIEAWARRALHTTDAQELFTEE